MSEPARWAIKHKQGDTMLVEIRISEEGAGGTFTGKNLTGHVFTAQARNRRTKVLETQLTVTLKNQTTDAGWLTVRAEKEDTDTWPPGQTLTFDLQYDLGFDRYTVADVDVEVLAQSTLP